MLDPQGDRFREIVDKRHGKGRTVRWRQGGGCWRYRASRTRLDLLRQLFSAFDGWQKGEPVAQAAYRRAA
jgi:hypothetical protein